MKKLIALIFMIFLFVNTGSVFAYDDVRSFKIEPAEITLVPGESVTVQFKFNPEGAIGPVKLNSEEVVPDTSIATAQLNADKGTVTVTGIRPGTTKFCFSCELKLLSSSNIGYTYLTVNVVSDPVISLSSDITSVNTVFTDRNQSTLVKLTLQPESALNLVRYSSDNDAVAQIIPSNAGPTYFFISIKGPGSTTVHFTAGSKKVDIPVIVGNPASGAAFDPVLPVFINKNDVKAAYDKYIKPYNTPFQDGEILNCNIDGTTITGRNNTDALNSKDLKVGQDFTNFFRALAGVSPMSYTSSLNTEAQYGATFMKNNSYGHSAADGIDNRASNVLHSSNIYRNGFTVNEVIYGWFNERNNSAGIMAPGHRSWMLDPLISSYGIARDNGYWAQMYPKENAFSKSSSVFAIPSNGYFPVEAFQTSTDPWSLYLGTVYYVDPNKIKVSVTNNKGETINLAYNDLRNSQGTFTAYSGYGSGSNIIIYPRKFVGDYANINSTETLIGQSFTVTIEGLEITSDRKGESYDYVPCKPLTYTTHFISIKEEGWNPHIDSFTITDTSTGKPLESSFTLKVGETKTVKLTNVSPNTYASESELRLRNDLWDTALGSKKGSEDKNSFDLTGKAPGSGTITFYINNTGFEKSYQVTVLPADPENSNPTDSSGSNSPDPSKPGQPGSSNESTSSKVTIYRLYNSTNGEHLYTTDYNEVQTLVGQHGWTDEGVGWYAPENGKAVYRLYNAGLQNHLYTTDTNEVNELTSKHGWTKDFNGEPLFYSGGSIPVYRVYNQALRGLHHLTTDENEYHTLPAHGWTQENIALNAVAKP